MVNDPDNRPTFGQPPSLDDIAELAERALAAIPARLARHVEGVGITVEESADDETLDEMEIESPWELTGLYRGTPLIARSVDDIARQPDLIFLYREAILLEWFRCKLSARVWASLMHRATFMPRAPRSRLRAQLGLEHRDVVAQTVPCECSAAARCRRL